MKKLILIAVLLLVSSSVFAQDIFGPPNYFFKRNDSVFVRPGSVFGSASSQSIDTSLIAFLNQNNTFTGAINIFTGKMVVGTGTSNGTADFLVMGDTTTLRGTVLRDSSMLRVMVNPFSQRLKISAIGKTGNNMFTIDSTLISSALAMSITGDFNSLGNIVAGSNNKNIRWLGKTVMYANNDGELNVMNYAETSFVKFTVGAGNFTAGFIRGTVDTDITAPFFRSPNGTLYYLLVSDAGVLSTSTTAP